MPVLMAAGGATLAAISPSADEWVGEDFRFAYIIPREDAFQLLSTILTSMITMTSLVFSITMVVLSLAAGQFGPRLIRNYMARRPTQIVLGTFVMTIIFCLLLVVRIGQTEGEAASAPVSIPVAVGLTLVSVMMLIFHIHLLAWSMLSETIIELVGKELDEAIDELEPLRGGEDREDPETFLPPGFEQDARVVGVARHGYVQAIDFADLVEMAQDADGFAFLAAGPAVGPTTTASSAPRTLVQYTFCLLSAGPSRSCSLPRFVGQPGPASGGFADVAVI